MIQLIPLLGPIIEKALSFIPDPQKKAEAQLKLQEEINRHSETILSALQQADKGQTDINVEEAKSTNWIVAGWRPSLGWVCSLAFAWSYVFQPVMVFILTASGHPIKDLPVLNMSEMMPILLGMLGLAGVRTWEKINDVHGDH